MDIPRTHRTIPILLHNHGLLGLIWFVGGCLWTASILPLWESNGQKSTPPASELIECQTSPSQKRANFEEDFAPPRVLER